MSKSSEPSLCLRFAIASLAILVFGVALVFAAEGIAAQSGLGNSFIGVTLLAAATLAVLAIYLLSVVVLFTLR